jgi:hypothetical protein
MSSPAGRYPEDRSAALRASDADREHTAQLLGRAFAEGRLTPDEHSERIEAVYSARTMGELRPLVDDLPVDFAPPSAVGMPPQGAGTGRGVIPAGPGRQVVAVFSEAKRSGRWLVPAHLGVRAFFGSVHLDLTEAVLEQREVTIVANAIFGEVVIVVPEGVIVHDEGTAIFGQRNNPSSAVGFTPDTPVIRLSGTALFGSVQTKTPKRKWLGRR